jgi:tetratricopeptide (TPR) repeat protein
MACPRCGLEDAAGESCARCGVIFAKLQPARPRPARPVPSPEPEPSGGLTVSRLATVAAALAGMLWLGLEMRRPKGAAAPAPRVSATLPSVPAEFLAKTPAPSLTPPPASLAPAPAPSALTAQAGIPPEDVKRGNDLVFKLNARLPVTEADLKAAEELRARHPGEEKLLDLVEGLLLSLAMQERSQRRYAEAQARLRRAIQLRPGRVDARAALITVQLETNDFTGAETSAREALAVEPRNAELLLQLAFALFRQDKNREAAEAAQSSLQARDNEGARALLAMIQKGQRDERGMSEQQLAHFHVRYDGDAHEDVGREILRQLEHHYATLARSFDHQPGTAIPVILFSRAQYFNASGAPAWSGGVYDMMDGRIRIPIGGLSTSLTPEMDGTLIHELSHAFIHDMSRGIAPREVHEGVAQYMEGKRVASLFTSQQLAAIADGRAGGVGGFYAQALAFAEYLIATRGSGGINDLLRAMGETGDVNAAFSRVHGQSYEATVRAFRQRLKQQHGS